jgi:hypothetical protein
MPSRSARPRRPDAARWLWYAVSGRLPMRYREWVLHDLTCATWPLRHLARLLVPLVPVAALLIPVLPGPLSLRVMSVAVGAVVGLSYTFVYLHESTDRRAGKFGYPSGTAQAVREGRRRRPIRIPAPRGPVDPTDHAAGPTDRTG